MKHFKILDDESNDDWLVLEGPLFLFGGKDLTGEFFTPETDSESNYTKSLGRLPIDAEHGFKLTDDYPGWDDVLGYVDAATIRDDKYGRLARHLLDRRNKYVELVYEPLARAQLLGSSSQAVPEGVRKTKTGEITKWPLMRQALTVEPAEPRLLTEHQLQIVKSVVEQIPQMKSIFQDGQETVKDDNEEPGQDNIEPTENNKMDDKNVNFITRDEHQREIDEILAKLKTVEGFSSKLDTLIETLEKSPQAKKAGMVAPDDETGKPEVKSFGDFLVSVRRGNVKRLQSVYGSTKDMSSETGGAGGYLVPEEFSTALLNVMTTQNQISSRVFEQPVITPSGRYPFLDVFVAPTAGSGQTALSGGLSPAVVAEGAAYGEDQPTFEMLEWRAKKIGEVVDVPEELVDDSGVAIQALLTRLFAIATDAIVERNIIRGTGNTQFLGILNSAAAIGVTPATNNTFAGADALSMLSRFKPMPAGNPVWIMHRGVIPDFNTTNFPASAQSMVEWNNQLPTSLLGYPILYSEHSPQDDNAGDVILADLSAYILFNRRQLTIAFSEHAKFENDLVVWKYNIRADGMPWMKGPITLADPQGSYTVSPFVYHND